MVGSESSRVDSRDAESYQLEVDLSPREAAEAVEIAAGVWNAEWQPSSDGGRLSLPVLSGLRRGFVTGELSIAKAGGGSVLRFAADGAVMRLNFSAVVILLFGALGGVTVALWPFFPELLSMVPLGIVLALVAWLLVASRLRSRGPKEFLAFIETMASDGEDEQPPTEPS